MLNSVVEYAKSIFIQNLQILPSKISLGRISLKWAKIVKNYRKVVEPAKNQLKNGQISHFGKVNPLPSHLKSLNFLPWLLPTSIAHFLPWLLLSCLLFASALLNYNPLV